MRERPILFSAPMVRAILAGRKTQTRRVVKNRGRPPEFRGPSGCTADVMCWGWEDGETGDHIAIGKPDAETASGLYLACPYGVPGDRLWVKETWRPFKAFQPWGLDIRYHADGAERTITDGEFGERDWTMPKPDPSDVALGRHEWRLRAEQTLSFHKAKDMTEITEAEPLIDRLKSSAAAFRQYPIHTADGDPVFLKVRADELEEAASELTRLQEDVGRLAGFEVDIISDLENYGDVTVADVQTAAHRAGLMDEAVFDPLAHRSHGLPVGEGDEWFVPSARLATLQGQQS